MKSVSISILVLIVLLFTVTFSGCSHIKKVTDGVDVMPSGGQFGELFEQDMELRLMVGTATIAILEGTEKFLSAAGNQEAAAKYKESAAALRENPKDPQNIKDSQNLIDTSANDDINKIMAEKQELSAAAKKELAMGVVLVGAGGVSDGLAGVKAGKFVTEISSSLSEATKDPIKFSGEIPKLKESLDLMKFLAENLPAQSTSIGQTVTGMIKFAQAHDVEVSKEDINDKAAGMTKG